MIEFHRTPRQLEERFADWLILTAFGIYSHAVVICDLHSGIEAKRVRPSSAATKGA